MTEKIAGRIEPRYTTQADYDKWKAEHADAPLSASPTPPERIDVYSFAQGLKYRAELGSEAWNPLQDGPGARYVREGDYIKLSRQLDALKAEKERLEKESAELRKELGR